MPTEQTAAPKLKTNLDTGLLKLIAILSMAVDHVGSVFFPKYPVFRWIGRLTFPSWRDMPSTGPSSGCGP